MHVYRAQGLYEVRRTSGERVAIFFRLEDAQAFIRAFG
jgi:hypothetical protein